MDTDKEAGQHIQEHKRAGKQAHDATSMVEMDSDLDHTQAIHFDHPDVSGG
jgi:hypothetical protein